MKSLKRELDSMAATISYLYNAKTQRSRIEKLYGSQLDHIFDRKGSSLYEFMCEVVKFSSLIQVDYVFRRCSHPDYSDCEKMYFVSLFSFRIAFQKK